MRAETLTSLIDLLLVLEPEGRGRSARFTAGEPFRMRLALTSHAERPLKWAAGKPLTLSYRWFDTDGNVLDVPDRRTVLPTRSLVPLVRHSVVVEGVCPLVEGSYALQLSLVLEEVHWAADASSSGWLKLPIDVRPAVEWPKCLRASGAGKALRGAFVSVDLAAELGPRPFAAFDRPAQEHTVESDAEAASEPCRHAGPHDVVAFAIKQQQRLLELTGELHRRQRKLDELEQQVQDLVAGHAQGASAEQEENLGHLLSKLQLTVENVLSRGKTSDKELQEGDPLVDIARSLRELLSSTQTARPAAEDE